MAVLAAVWTPRPAFAHEFIEPYGGFSVTLEPQAGERFCVIYPLGSAQPSECVGLDVGRFEGLALSPIAPWSHVGLGVLRRADDQVYVTIQRAAELFDVELHGEPVARAGVQGVAMVLGATIRKLSHRVIVLGGRDALRADAELALGDVMFRCRFLMMQGGSHTYGLAFTTTTTETQWLDRIEQQAVDSVKADVIPMEAPTSSPPREKPLSVVSVLGALAFGLLLAIGAILMVVLKMRGKQTAASQPVEERRTRLVNPYDRE